MVTDAEHALLTRSAARAEVSLSTWLRLMGVKAARAEQQGGSAGRDAPAEPPPGEKAREVLALEAVDTPTAKPQRLGADKAQA